jgi:hypothetical protein
MTTASCPTPGTVRTTSVVALSGTSTTAAPLAAVMSISATHGRNPAGTTNEPTRPTVAAATDSRLCRNFLQTEPHPLPQFSP